MRPQRYTIGAWAYDVLSAEWPVYRIGRLAAIRALHLRPGHRVLDVGCGTGLNFPLLRAAIGPRGHIVGVDASASMLRQAHRRIARARWENVDVVRADATTVSPEQLANHFPCGDEVRPVDAVLFTYTLSIMADWRSAWRSAIAIARPGARIAVVDMTLPIGAAALLSPLARAACALGGADLRAHPWQAVEQETHDVDAWSLRGGHIQVRAGAIADRQHSPDLAE